MISRHLIAAISMIAAGSLSADYYVGRSDYYYPNNQYHTSDATMNTPGTMSGSYGPGYSTPTTSGNYGSGYTTYGNGSPGFYGEDTNSPYYNPNYNPNNEIRGNSLPGQPNMMDHPNNMYNTYGSPQAMNNPYPPQGNMGPMDKAMKMSSDNDKFTTDEDRRLGFQIRQQIAERNPTIDLGRIYLYIDDGTVRLTGQVKNERERNDLSTMIKEIKGVKSLNNRLELSPYGANQPRGTLAMETYPGSPMGPASPTGPGSPSGPIGPNSYSSQSSTSTFPNSTTNWPNTYKGNTSLSGQDTSLADKIRTAISTDTSFSPQAQNIGITISSNSITLNGTVRTESEKNRIASKVREMSEGRAINNMLEVSPPGTLPR